MTPEKMLAAAIEYENKIRDMYLAAAREIDDDRGKAFFKALAEDEQSHVDFLDYSCAQLKKKEAIDPTALKTSLQMKKTMDDDVAKMAKKIPDQMLGNIQRLLNAALKLEIETSAFYKKAAREAEAPIKNIFEKFYEIEQRHVDMVQVELDHASNTGHWFNAMEIDMEHG